ncbi:hypothetical protein PR048_015763 [Dryococelus australis]|uniref:Uncharacterized protein n=1 Tax=Dryococelus australis TaxID=614101 RepID=A0ABQ9HHW4_9NEOP|nr:hypothetical protein PR048_015763 [Dryococelus australis]
MVHSLENALYSSLGKSPGPYYCMAMKYGVTLPNTHTHSNDHNNPLINEIPEYDPLEPRKYKKPAIILTFQH